MTGAAYVDTSCLVAVALGEPGYAEVGEEMEGLSDLFSSNLLEAELRSAFAREGLEESAHFLTWITWVLPDRPLRAEIGWVLEAGHARGADTWHLASALYLAEDPADLAFFTLAPACRSPLHSRAAASTLDGVRPRSE